MTWKSNREGDREDIGEDSRGAVFREAERRVGENEENRAVSQASWVYIPTHQKPTTRGMTLEPEYLEGPKRLKV